MLKDSLCLILVALTFLSLPLCPFVVEDTTNLPPSPPPSPAAEHFGPLEQGRPRICVHERMFLVERAEETVVSFFFHD